MRRFLFAITLFFPLFAFAYISPGKPSGMVNDFAGVLTPEQRNSLENTLLQNQKDTGNEISVVTVKNLGGDTVDNYAVKLFEEWGIGKKGKDNGVLFLISIDDRQMRIEVGYGLEPVLTDITSGQIIRNAVAPKFKTGDYYGGISDGVAQIISSTKGEAVSATDNGGNKIASFGDIAKFLIIIPWFLFGLLQWIVSIFARSKSWWAGGVAGGIIGLVFMLFVTFIHGLVIMGVLIPLGLLFDYLVSREYTKSKEGGRKAKWWAGGGPWMGGGFGGGGGGGFGGFGGGRSGGGGASGGW